MDFKLLSSRILQILAVVLISVLVFFTESSHGKVHETEEEALYLTAAVGESVVFNCALEFPHNVPIPYILQYSKDNEPVFSWSDRNVSSRPEFTRRVSLVSEYPKYGKGSINLTNVHETDAGWYECRLYFPNRSPSTGLNGTWYYLEVLGGNLLAVPPTNQTATEGDSVTITCITKDKDAIVNWYKDDVILAELKELNERCSISPEGSLTINPVSMTDPGNYKCEIINNQGESQHASAYLEIQYKAKILFSPREVYFSYGRPGTLDCHFKANPLLTNLRWEKDGFLFDPYNVQGVYYRRNGSLYFSKVDESHAGEYTCTPYNLLGTEGPSPPIHVVVQRPPIFTVTPHNLYLRKTGESIEIPCDALDGDKAARPSIVWFRKDGNPLARDRTIVNGGNLTIVNIHEEDRGFYQCVASNEAATISSETELMIENTAPRAPYNLTAQATKNSISVKWIPGFIKPRLEYSVWYRAVDLPEWRTLKIRSRDTSEAVITNLSPGREYELMVLSQDQHGDGMFSKTIKVVTKSTGSLDAEQFRSPAGSFMHIGKANIAEVQIEPEGYIILWEAPHVNQHMVKEYTLKWYEDYEDNLVGTYVTKDTSYTIPYAYLHEGRTYYFQVVTVSTNDFETSSFKYPYTVPSYRTKRALGISMAVGLVCFVLIAVGVCYVKNHWVMIKTDG